MGLFFIFLNNWLVWYAAAGAPNEAAPDGDGTNAALWCTAPSTSFIHPTFFWVFFFAFLYLFLVIFFLYGVWGGASTCLVLKNERKKNESGCCSYKHTQTHYIHQQCIVCCSSLAMRICSSTPLFRHLRKNPLHSVTRWIVLHAYFCKYVCVPWFECMSAYMLCVIYLSVRSVYAITWKKNVFSALLMVLLYTLHMHSSSIQTICGRTYTNNKMLHICAYLLTTELQTRYMYVE